MEKMKKLSTKALNKLIAKNNKWFKTGKLKKIVYENLDLSEVELSNVSFENAEFRNVKFEYATLIGVDFSKAIFFNVSFYAANFYNCKFNSCYNEKNLNFSYTHIKDADFSYADIESATFYNAYLENVNFTDTLCYCTDFRDATVKECNFNTIHVNATTAGYALACPEKGSFTAFKKAALYNKKDCIVELEVPADALRSSATTRKCRVSKAKVVSITTLDGKPLNKNAYSFFSRSFVYKVGKTVEVKNFNTNRWAECAPGIHCFITRDEAVQYRY